MNPDSAAISGASNSKSAGSIISHTKQPRNDRLPLLPGATLNMICDVLWHQMKGVSCKEFPAEIAGIKKGSLGDHYGIIEKASYAVIPFEDYIHVFESPDKVVLLRGSIQRRSARRFVIAQEVWEAFAKGGLEGGLAAFSPSVGKPTPTTAVDVFHYLRDQVYVLISVKQELVDSAFESIDDEWQEIAEKRLKKLKEEAAMIAQLLSSDDASNEAANEETEASVAVAAIDEAGLFQTGAGVELGLELLKSKNESKKKDADYIEELENEIASLKTKNSKLETECKELSGIKAKANKLKEKLILKMEETAAAKDALEAESEALREAEDDLDSSQATIASQEEEIDTLKELIHNLKVELSEMEIMILFAEERAERIDIDELFDRTMKHIELTRGGVDQALDAIVKQYHS